MGTAGPRHRVRGLLLGTTLALLAAEGAARLICAPVDLAALTGRAAVHPMGRWAQVDAFCAYRARSGTYAHARKTINADGFMSTPDVPREKTPKALRVAFLGGSSTACTSPPLADGDTWPTRVAAALAERFPDRDVDYLNAALPGYSTFESYGRLWSRLRFWRPDVVVVYHGWNDLYYCGDGDADRLFRWRTQHDGGWSFDRAPAKPVLEPVAIDPWIGWSRLLSTLRVRASAHRGGESGRTRERADRFDPRGVSAFRENLQLLLAAQDVLGFRLFVAKQATLVVNGLRDELQAKCAYRLHGFGHDAHVAAFAALYAAIDEVVPADRILDLTHLSGRDDVFLDHVHLSPEGAHRLAADLEAQLGPRLESVFPARPR